MLINVKNRLNESCLKDGFYGIPYFYFCCYIFFKLSKNVTTGLNELIYVKCKDH